jgi:hypothetical protein
VFTTVRQPQYPTNSHLSTLRFNLILGYRVRLGHPRGLCPSGFPTKTLPAFLFSPLEAMSQLSSAAQYLAWRHNTIGPIPTSEHTLHFSTPYRCYAR